MSLKCHSAGAGSGGARDTRMVAGSAIEVQRHAEAHGRPVRSKGDGAAAPCIDRGLTGP